MNLILMAIMMVIIIVIVSAIIIMIKMAGQQTDVFLLTPFH